MTLYDCIEGRRKTVIFNYPGKRLKKGNQELGLRYWRLTFHLQWNRDLKDCSIRKRSRRSISLIQITRHEWGLTCGARSFVAVNVRHFLVTHALCRMLNVRQTVDDKKVEGQIKGRKDYSNLVSREFESEERGLLINPEAVWNDKRRLFIESSDHYQGLPS